MLENVFKMLLSDVMSHFPKIWFNLSWMNLNGHRKGASSSLFQVVKESMKKLDFIYNNCNICHFFRIIIFLSIKFKKHYVVHNIILRTIY
ncbi:unnamed protein product [Schistosoma curassoni]|uniref:Uncharacterized protein n=1 Tax=Schistosoma curassoni TaxID=6186 RepID=A0A183KNN6_9TREM|nr:unnamed protein product [Schistosoma curassoni]